MPPTAGMPRDAPHQEQIVLAAIALLDEGGIESLTLRRLGSSLGSTAAALHWHIKSRHDLLLLAADAVWGQTPLPALDGLEWRPALLAMADNLRSTLLRHPWLLAAMTIQPLDGPARDRHDEHLLAVCEASGLTRRDAEHAAQSVVAFAIGAALADSPSPRSAFAWRYHPRRDSELILSSRATAVTVLPEESTSAIASRLNSSVYRFVHCFPPGATSSGTSRSPSPGVHDQGEASILYFGATWDSGLARARLRDRACPRPPRRGPGHRAYDLKGLTRKHSAPAAAAQ